MTRNSKRVLLVKLSLSLVVEDGRVAKTGDGEMRVVSRFCSL